MIALLVLFLFGSMLLAGGIALSQRLGRWQVEEELERHPYLFERPLRLLFGKHLWEGFLFAMRFGKTLFLLAFACSALLLFYSPAFSLHELFLLVLSLFGLVLVAHLLMELLASLRPQLFVRYFAPLLSLFLLPFALVLSPFFKLLQLFIHSDEERLPAPIDIREKILQTLRESELVRYLDESDQKLILSVASFRSRMVREVMVPRIDVFALSAETTVEEAAREFMTQGYSRIPVFRESIDEVIGQLHYKDILKLMAEAGEEKERSRRLRTPIESCIKPVLYTPETKKLSNLLQEFRGKQIHLAIVVDEWGGTEGIVTIEDILEELVGEIADEYDIDEEALFSTLPGGGWIVDGKMSIIDIEEELAIRIPQDPDYDTIGGYLIHRAGTIPAKGWKLHGDEFDLEVLASDERSVDKVRITPHRSQADA